VFSPKVKRWPSNIACQWKIRSRLHAMVANTMQFQGIPRFFARDSDKNQLSGNTGL